MIDVDTLEAGPELDALVAEKVMGWIGRENELWTDRATGKVQKWGTDNCTTINDATTSFYFRPSTDIAAAWEIIEKKCIPYVKVDARGLHRGGQHFRWVCQIWNGSSAEILGLAQTAPLAICRAALKAVGA